MKILTLTAFLVFTAVATCFGQYYGPNSITYDAVSKVYYVSNTDSGTITRLNASFQTSTVITGLTEPKGLFFIAAGANQLLIVLDVNKIKVFDPSSYSLIQTVTVTGATNLEDAVLDLLDPDVFYLSDRGGNKIIRGELGPAPFYIPTFSDLKTGIDRPTGLWFDNLGRLLMVQDTTNSPISRIDTANGNVTLVKSTGLHYLNSIIQDAQGNYYITSWGDDNLYRFKPDFSDSVVINTYNDPTGFYFNPSLDLLITACSKCNKLEFLKLHLFIPAGNISGCPGDSATVLFNSAYKSTGTYSSFNNFVVEISDSLGSFISPKVAGYVTSDTDPTSIRIKIPSENYGSGNLLFRVKSTNPLIYSPEYNLTINPLPVAKASDYDILGSCVNASVSLGENPKANHTYSWSPGINLNDSLLANPVYTSVATGDDTLYVTVSNTLTGCKATDHVVISTQSNLTLPQLNEIVSICQGDSAAIGVTNVSYQFAWTPDFALSDDSVSNPVTGTPGDIKYYVTFTDSASGCSGTDSVVVLVNPLPDPANISDSFTVCRGEVLQIAGNPSANDRYEWSPPDHLSTDTGLSVSFQSGQSGVYEYNVAAISANDCRVNSTVVINVLQKPSPQLQSIEFLEGGISDSIDLSWTDSTGTSFANIMVLDTHGNAFTAAPGLPEGNSRFAVSNFDQFRNNGEVKFQYFLVAENPNGCATQSDTFNYFKTSVQNLHLLPFNLYPNPARNSITVTGQFPTPVEIVLLNLSGQTVLQFSEVASGQTLDVSGLPAGLYTARVTDDEGRSGVRKIALY